MSSLEEILALLLGVAEAALALAVRYVKRHPVATGLALFALLRLCGTTVQSGTRGVLFVFGRVRKELEPGFTLVPVVMKVRTTPVRSITLDLPRQRLTTADGLAYDAQANIVYRVADPKLALTQIDNLRHGIEAVLPLIVEGLLREQTRAAVMDFKALEIELSARAGRQLRRWGVAVEQAGFKSIAPTKKSLRLTQLAVLVDERQRLLQELIAQGVPVLSALALLGADRRLVGHSTARYRALHRRAHLAPVAAETPRTPPLLPGEEPPVAAAPPQGEEVPAPEPQALDVLVGMGGAPAPPPPRPKKTTRGIQPRSWLRHKWRLQLRRPRPAPPAEPTPGSQPPPQP